MCTSDIEKKNHSFGNTAFIYLIVSLFLALTGAVYECFSHDVYSYSMIYAFVPALVLGTFLNMILERIGAWRPGNLTKQFWHCGVATLTVGFLISGVFSIYGSSNGLINVFYIAGPMLLLIGGIKYLAGDKKNKN